VSACLLGSWDLCSAGTAGAIRVKTQRFFGPAGGGDRGGDHGLRRRGRFPVQAHMTTRRQSTFPRPGPAFSPQSSIFPLIGARLF
jgi:hypothetical protein